MFFRDEIEKKKMVKELNINGDGHYINRVDGEKSDEFLKKLIITRDKRNGKVNGAIYKHDMLSGEKIIIGGKGHFAFSENKKFKISIEVFKDLYAEAVEEHKKSRLYEVEEIVPEEAPLENVLNIDKDAMDKTVAEFERRLEEEKEKYDNLDAENKRNLERLQDAEKEHALLQAQVDKLEKDNLQLNNSKEDLEKKIDR